MPRQIFMPNFMAYSHLLFLHARSWHANMFPDTKEGLYFGREVSADDPEASQPLTGPNQWPSEVIAKCDWTIFYYNQL